jgi:transposase
MNDEREAKLLLQLKEKDAQVESLTNQLARAEQEIKLLRRKMDALLQRLFGAKSEQIDSTQLLLLLQEEEAPGPAAGKESGPELSEALTPRPLRKSPPQKAKPRIPENLPVVEEVLEPAAVKAAPEQWRRIGEEVTELLDYEPGRFLRRRTVRPKYIRRGDLDAAPIIAPLPDRILAGGIAAPGLLAQIVVSKFCDHLPLYRQQYIYDSRFGVELPRQTMARWMGEVAHWLKPIYQAIREQVMSGRYVQIDETPIRYLEPGRGETKLGYLWTCCRPGHDVIFHWHTSRSAQCLEKIVPVAFNGFVQCDGYKAYGAFARARREQGNKLTLAGCMAHVRREFFEARAEAPQVAGWLLYQFALLYKIEERLRQARAGPALREAVRAAESRMIHQRIQRALLRFKQNKRFLPQSGLGRAIDYALGRWSPVSVYLSSGLVEIDNNLVENAIRPTALGKKNWLFFGEAQAGERGAIIYTIIESCRRRGIDPYRYLRDVLERLPQATNWTVKELTPEAWARAQTQAGKAAA